MQKWFITCIIICLYASVFAQQHDPVSIRRQLVVALKSSETTDSLYKSLNAVKNKPALVTGYIATLQALKAVHAWNPFTKLKYLNKAEDTYRQAVAADPDNIEIRFMRFSVEHNVPGFLGFNKNLDADRKAIINQLKKKNYTASDHEMILTVVKFLIDSKRCTAAENEYLNKLLASLK
ncbi:hypothetical protein EOD41_06450 [Mucilaginibacter limnophilus]|uniref:Tetratricopeptide repeat protein n=1 Tax=Mucilaginibacter limnophilus TaxID=1932778 RepID=A0A437MVA0_9SPHI|nr:hypothetical protein [Mucilaginibacter limnophilus]RVU01602.1 hypothetical protein EOD41_06450 [Mucilaginibacter limnophilus]